ncbi:MAG: 3-dehydroquinate synthase [Francisellaceae bacterium]|jgi:3-dehydroquinate synthase|nr:3-dehydroquinate synthase [Francisellaceae bacterium]MBT6538441.1 3-dehydroquinate synthase [Francisellaceae bacterium]
MELNLTVKSKTNIWVETLTNNDYKEIFSDSSVLVIDENLFEIINSKISLSAYEVIRVQWSESQKSWDSINGLLDQFVRLQLKRTDTVIAIGGGLISDVVGFAASIYMRGIKWQVVSTTLLSQADACLGGKVGINGFNIKNIFGALHQPEKIYCDIGLLKYLSTRDYKNGLSEVCKYALAYKEDFYYWLLEHSTSIVDREEKILMTMVNRCLRYKADIVHQDVEDINGIRAILNFGHTFAHAIESTSSHAIMHGEAVAMGMKLAGKLSVDMGLLSDNDYERILQLLSIFGLNCQHPLVSMEQLYSQMLKDKKNTGNGVKLLLLNSIGSTIVCNNVHFRDLETLRMSYAKC